MDIVQRQDKLQEEIKRVERIMDNVHHQLSFDSDIIRAKRLLNIFESASQLMQDADKLLKKNDLELQKKQLLQTTTQYEQTILQAKDCLQVNKKDLSTLKNYIESIYKIQTSLIHDCFILKQLQSQIKTNRFITKSFRNLQEQAKSLNKQINPETCLAGSRDKKSVDTLNELYQSCEMQNVLKKGEKKEYKEKLAKDIDYLLGKQRSLEEDYSKIMKQNYQDKKQDIQSFKDNKKGQVNIRNEKIYTKNDKKKDLIENINSDLIKIIHKKNHLQSIIPLILSFLTLLIILSLYKR